MSWPPDKSNFRPLPLTGYQQAQPLAKAGDAKAGDVKAGDKAAGDAVKADSNETVVKQDVEAHKDKDQVDQEKTRTGGFDPEKSISFNNKAGGVNKTDEIGGDDSIPAGMGVAYAAASQSLEKNGLPPAVAKLRDELSPDISDEAIKEAMFQAALWSNAKPIA